MTIKGVSKGPVKVRRVICPGYNDRLKYGPEDCPPSDVLGSMPCRMLRCPRKGCEARVWVKEWVTGVVRGEVSPTLRACLMTSVPQEQRNRQRAAPPDVRPCL
jgi:hypothetical protein